MTMPGPNVYPLGAAPAKPPTRAERRHQRFSRAYLAADMPGDKMAQAYDWFRSSALHLATRGGRLAGGERRRRAATAARLMNDAAQYLADLASDIDNGHYGE